MVITPKIILLSIIDLRLGNHSSILLGHHYDVNANVKKKVRRSLEKK